MKRKSKHVNKTNALRFTVTLDFEAILTLVDPTQAWPIADRLAAQIVRDLLSPRVLNAGPSGVWVSVVKMHWPVDEKSVTYGETAQ